MAVDALCRPLCLGGFTGEGCHSGNAANGRRAAGDVRAERWLIQELALAECADAFAALRAGDIDYFPLAPLAGRGRRRLRPPFLIEERRCEASAMVRGTL